ncbi:hypothetical protein DEO72_LG11g3131 [Vigna unguiculata]|uniref:Secreted protein n=1 Tax=Vigna unguiculata TaxID=3917 RepID=A0A4D6NRX2_VIGUN|nr:hypothetical protein DEO72_LG11g3131 [Vigna unguiculata]
MYSLIGIKLVLIVPARVAVVTAFTTKVETLDQCRSGGQVLTRSLNVECRGKEIETRLIVTMLSFSFFVSIRAFFNLDSRP